MKNKATAVLLDGAFPNANPFSDWEEFPEWYVGLMDDDGNEVGDGKMYRNFEQAHDAAVKLSRKLKIEFVNEASPWF